MKKTKTAWVTGASRGIGRQAALALSGEYNLIINCKENEAALMELSNQLSADGTQVLALLGDVSSRADVLRMANAAADRFGGVDVLVNNAGIAQQKVFGDITPQDWDAMIGVNLSGVFYCTQAVLPHMIRKKSGRIINISSVWGICGASCEVHYSAAKAGVIGLTKALAQELAPSHITVNCVAPGVIRTDMCTFDAQTEALICEDIPFGQFGTPKDAANAISFLASEAARYITGQVLNVSGGYVV